MQDVVRIVHTADVHLDMCFSGAGMPPSYGNRRRQSLRDAFSSIVRRAGEWNADALLIAGDLFEGDRVTRDTIGFLRSEFTSIPNVPVLIAPGNHDPFTPTSPYATETWPENVHIFDTPEWQSVALRDGHVAVHGFAFDGPDISSNPFGMLTLSPDASVQIALGHGSEQAHQPEGKQAYAPFDASEAALRGLDYLALGHFHTYTPIDVSAPTTIAYSGAPEGHGFGETGERGYLEITIENSALRSEFVVSSRSVYQVETIDCTDVESSQDVVLALRNLSQASSYRQIARVSLSGSPAFDVASEIDSLHDAVAPDFEYLDLRNDTRSAEDFDALARQDTSLGAFVAALNEEIGDVEPGGRTQMLERARELGVAAFRDRRVPIRGLDRSSV